MIFKNSFSSELVYVEEKRGYIFYGEKDVGIHLCTKVLATRI